MVVVVRPGIRRKRAFRDRTISTGAAGGFHRPCWVWPGGSERKLAGQLQAGGARPGVEPLVVGGATVQRAPQPWPAYPAAGFLCDQCPGREVVLVQAPLAVGVMRAVRHHAQVQGGGTKPADVGEAVHEGAEGGSLLATDVGLVAESRGQDLPG